MDHWRGQNALRRFAVVALAAGLLGLVIAPRDPSSVSWTELLQPYSSGAPLLREFRLDDIRRGSVRDVILRVVGRGGEVAAEVHILPRGTWPGVRSSRSFDIAYETPHSPSTRREEITELLAATVRRRDHGLPSPDVIPLRLGADSTVLPWWLEMLRGWRGVSLGIGLLLSGVVTLVPSPASSVAGVAFGLGILLWRALGLAEGRVDIFGPWFLPVSAILIVAGSRGHIVVASADRLYALGLTFTALALRLLLGPWAPLHVNGYGPRFVAGVASDGEAIASYGAGYVELFWWAAALAPTNADWLIFAGNGFLSALAVPLAFALARAAAIDRSVAAAAALVLAVDPIAIRFAATESYFPSIIFLCAAAGVALVVASRAVRVGDGRAALLCMIGAALLLVQAVRVHPAAWLPAATVPALLLAAGGGPFRKRFVAAAAGSFIVPGVVVATSGDSLLDVLGNVRSGVLMRPATPLSLWPALWGAALAVVCALRAPARWLGPAAAACVIAVFLTRDLYGQSWIWRQAYDRLFLTVPVVAIAAAFSPPAVRTRVVVGLATLTTVLWLAVALPVVSFRTTDQLEYRWLRRQLRGIPEECRVVHLAAVGNRGVEIPTYVRPPSSPAVAISARRRHSHAEAFAAAPCIYYVHTSLCSSIEAGGECASIEDAVELERVASETFPARPNSIYTPYDRDPVTSWIGRIRKSTAAGVVSRETD